MCNPKNQSSFLVPTLFSTSKQSFLILIPPKRARKKRAPTQLIHSNTQTFSYIPEGEISRKSLTYIAKKPLPVHEGKALREMKQPRGIIKRYARLLVQEKASTLLENPPEHHQSKHFEEKDLFNSHRGDYSASSARRRMPLNHNSSSEAARTNRGEVLLQRSFRH